MFLSKRNETNNNKKVIKQQLLKKAFEILLTYVQSEKIISRI